MAMANADVATEVYQFGGVANVEAISIQIMQKPHDGIPFRLWKASHALCRWLSQGQDASALAVVKGRRVLELGAGCGLVGICCARLGAEVTLTDLGYVIPFTRSNVKLNSLPDTSVRELAWGEDVRQQFPRGSFDVIIGSDIIYYAHLHRPLLVALLQLVGEGTEVVISHAHRYGQQNETWRSHMDAYFTIEHLHVDDQQERVPIILGGLPSDIPDEEAEAPVTIFMLRPRVPLVTDADIDRLLEPGDRDELINEFLDARAYRSARSRDAMCALPEDDSCDI